MSTTYQTNEISKYGVSTTKINDTFVFQPIVLFRSNKIQWDYRDINGKLHSGIDKNLDIAKEKAIKFGYKEIF